MKTEQDLLHFLGLMWVDYCKMNPQAQEIYTQLSKNNKVVNDHIALRTFNHPKLGIQSLAQHFEAYGYEARGDYTFTEKKLCAKHYEHKNNPDLPKIFISELELEKVSPYIQETINQVVEQIPNDKINTEDFIYSGTHWEADYQVYSKLAETSEYASWVYAFGFRPNHFTVSINHLTQFEDIAPLNEYIKSLGFKLNTSGGEIKGTASEYLEQSSTMANEVPLKFKDGVHHVPACYYEFAKRYPLQNGHLYQGFIAKSADKIFESTNKKN